MVVYAIVNAAQHPDGTDIIFYPKEDEEDSPEGVLKRIKEWRAANGLPGFQGWLTSHQQAPFRRGLFHVDSALPDSLP